MRIVIFAPSDVHSLELSGLTDVFSEANLRVAENRYQVEVVAVDEGPIECGSGLRILPNHAYHRISDAPDTLLMAGSVGVPTKLPVICIMAIFWDPATPNRAYPPLSIQQCW